jgi:hypothetical protein
MSGFWGAAGVFIEKLREKLDVVEVILFGSFARGGRPCGKWCRYRGDLAWRRQGQKLCFDFSSVAIDIAYDIFLDSLYGKPSINLCAFRIKGKDWTHPSGFSNPAILENIKRDGILLW